MSHFAAWVSQGFGVGPNHGPSMIPMIALKTSHSIKIDSVFALLVQNSVVTTIKRHHYKRTALSLSLPLYRTRKAKSTDC